MDDINLFSENVIYEVLITTFECGIFHTKPFGMKINDNKIILNLFPNKTLYNLKQNPNFIIQINQNPLIYVKSATNQLHYEDYVNNNILKDTSHVLIARVLFMDEIEIKDSYGKNVLTEIIAEPLELKKLKNTIPLINRATNIIIDLLVDYSRFYYMTSSEKEKFCEKLVDCERIIKKTGTENHLESLMILKNEIKLE
ncbi:DUF447 domain-containing protein [Methanosphaera sp. WGK6]|uniref:DUF447 domain-containing protein n=1 Tax=Methanosphaera sp. WGK6 TaxID=1561964 RepID=UPI00084BED51|nr:DUF447 domain-containing protein [Methanosphaera sp. WGK6]OED30627.1 hypothetical protein NL43_01415 [Methanosphaera sp. WGK6]